MSIFADLQTPTLDNRSAPYLAAYLALTGWSSREYARWVEYLGASDAKGEPLMLVLPRDYTAPDTHKYVAKALDLLSALNEESETTVLLRVLNVYCDVFVLRNIETGFHASIPIRVADQQVNELKHLVNLSARAEREPRPYYENQSNPVGNYLELFRFGHTVRGSFAFTIEAPLIHEVERFISEPTRSQLSLFGNVNALIDIERHQPENIERSPVERRIIERIMRGLVATRKATEESSIAGIVSEYGSGFSGNMCNSFARLANDTGPIEYGVLWSPKFPVAQDLQEHKSIKLDEQSYVLLKEAAQEMRRTHPEENRVRGIITHFGSDVPPLGEDDQGREVIIDWHRGEGQRRADIVVPLNREQYMRAMDAHQRWATVEITGKVVRNSSGFRLVDPHDLEVLN